MFELSKAKIERHLATSFCWYLWAENNENEKFNFSIPSRLHSCWSVSELHVLECMWYKVNKGEEAVDYAKLKRVMDIPANRYIAKNNDFLTVLAWSKIHW